MLSRAFPTQFQVRFTAACVKSCVCCKHAAQLTAAVATQLSSSKTGLLFRMPIQACEAREKVIHCADLSHQQKGQMLAQIINCPDRALPLFDVPEFLLADTLSAHLQGPPAGTVQLCVSCCADADAPPRSCCSQSRGGVLLLRLPEPSLACLTRSSFSARHINVLICCGFRLW